MNTLELQQRLDKQIKRKEKVERAIERTQGEIKELKSKAANTIQVAGLNWALCNLGTDLDTPHGRHYTFDEAQKAIPDGWRLPTFDEFKQLHDRTTHEWINRDGLNGMLFTDTDNGNEIFFPAAGHRDYTDGALLAVGTQGVYWSSSIGNATYGLYLNFHAGYVYPQLDTNRMYGFPLRCVQ
ncbi:MAG: FISUMP domain-containing protein [Mucinivorans sp.]